MLLTGSYQRERARAYAEKWAFLRNPLFTDFTGIGGNCTNFVSQCVYAGSCQMNFTPVYGWYYLSADDRAPAFTGVEYFYNFLTTNEGVGPFGREVGAEEVLVGDVVQLGREEGDFYHTLLVVGRDEEGDLLLAAQSDDAYARKLSTYTYARIRYLSVDGVRYTVGNLGDCYEPLFEGVELLIGGAGRYQPT